MSRYRRCWVPNCQNREASRKPKLFHFPRNSKRCLQWLKAVGDPSLASCQWRTLISGRYVCINHFMPNMISASNRVLSTAVPNVFSDVRPKLPDWMFKTFLESTPEYFGRATTSCAEDITWKSPETILSTSCEPAPDDEVDNGQASLLQLTSPEPDSNTGEDNGLAMEGRTWRRAMQKEDDEEVLESPVAVDIKVELKEEFTEKNEEIQKLISLKSLLGEESDEELEPLNEVFLDPEEATKEEVAEEYEDPLATRSEQVSIANEEHV